MKILQCIPSMVGGGAEQQLCYLAAGLVERGITTTVAFVGGGENLALLRKSGADLLRIPAASTYDPRILTRLAAEIRRRKIQLVQTWLPQMDVIGGLAALSNRIPFILAERSSEQAYRASFRVFARRLVGRQARAVVANSDAGAVYWRGVNGSRFSCVIRNGIPDPAQYRLVGPGPDASMRHPGGSRMILFVGRYHFDKNALVAGRAVARVLGRVCDATALFLGSGPDEAGLHRIVAEHRLHGRFVVGPFTPGARHFMSDAAVFLSTSNYEGNPNAVIEAAMETCPLVLSDIAPHREIIDDCAAIFVDQRNEDSIADGLERALCDRVGARQRAQRAAAAVRPLTLGNMVNAYIELYSQILRGQS